MGILHVLILPQVSVHINMEKKSIIWCVFLLRPLDFILKPLCQGCLPVMTVWEMCEENNLKKSVLAL